MIKKIKYWTKKKVGYRTSLGKMLKKQYHRLKKIRRCKGSLGILPDVLIIGAQKSGTSALFNYLIQHPQVGEPVTKEINYFTDNFEKGESWYRSFFPNLLIKKFYQKVLNLKYTSVDATPEYLLYPFIPKRAKEIIPDAKIIIILRKPADRAYSSFWHQKSKGRENRTFKEAIKLEEERIKKLKNLNKTEWNTNKFSYKARSRYYEQIKRWNEYFSLEEMLIIKSEDLKTQTEKEMQKVFEFLNLKKYDNLTDPVIKGRDYPPMDNKIKKKLEEYFQPHNEKLYKFLDRDFGW